MDHYSDGWKELKTALQLTQKKLLKKPNYNEALERLRHVSRQMLDLEMFDHAAICHKEMADIYLKLNNFIAERENWLKAADLYAKAYKIQKNRSITGRICCFEYKICPI
jgi:tetratricopeptide (TPR) repeat protein